MHITMFLNELYYTIEKYGKYLCTMYTFEGFPGHIRIILLKYYTL